MEINTNNISFSKRCSVTVQFFLMQKKKVRTHTYKPALQNYTYDKDSFPSEKKLDLSPNNVKEISIICHTSSHTHLQEAQIFTSPCSHMPQALTGVYASCRDGQLVICKTVSWVCGERIIYFVYLSNTVSSAERTICFSLMAW